MNVVRLVALLSSISSCCFLLFGYYVAYTRLYSSQECEMTWSQREFIEILVPRRSNNTLATTTRLAATATDRDTKNYRLFKFMDHRDPRHAHLLSLPRPLQRGEWCLDDRNKNVNTTTTAAVLYVPGHLGSYQQSRSLGAHGVQLTRYDISHARESLIRKSLASNTWNGQASRLQDFVYDVYSVDFQEEPSGLHSGFVRAQSKFITLAVQYLAATCHFKQIVIVAHSIGGYAARLSLTDLKNNGADIVRNIVTLATPHAHPILTWDAGMYKLHAQLKSDQKKLDDITLVSISGGLRDGMIPSLACDCSDGNSLVDHQYTNNLSLLATRLMRKRSNESTPKLGMDHRAIVWCHDLLRTLRGLLHTLFGPESVENESVSRKLSAVRRVQNIRKYLSLDDTYEFSVSVDRQKINLQRIFGTLPSIMIESALWHNTDWLVYFFSCNANWHYLLSTLSQIKSMHGRHLITPLMSILQCWLATGARNFPVPCMILLSFVGNAIYWALECTSFIVARRYCAASTTSPTAFNISNVLLRVRHIFTLLIFALSISLVFCLGLVIHNRQVMFHDSENTLLDHVLNYIAFTTIVSIFLFAVSLALSTVQLGSSMVTHFSRETSSEMHLSNNFSLSSRALLTLWTLIMYVLLVVGEFIWIILKNSTQPSIWRTAIPLLSCLVVLHVMGSDFPRNRSKVLSRTTATLILMARTLAILEYNRRVFRLKMNGNNESNFHPTFLLLIILWASEALHWMYLQTIGIISDDYSSSRQKFK